MPDTTPQDYKRARAVFIAGHHDIHGTELIEPNARAEKAIGRERAKCRNIGFLCLFNGRNDHVLFFFAQQAFVTCMGIQSQYCYAGIHNPKIHQQ